MMIDIILKQRILSKVAVAPKFPISLRDNVYASNYNIHINNQNILFTMLIKTTLKISIESF